MEVRNSSHVNPSNPAISVVIPAYNEAHFIEKTLLSLTRQTFQNFELIVVDNNSTDNTSEIAKNYGAKVICESQKGVAHARQSGFMAAKSEIIVSTDADTLLVEDWLERIVKKFSTDKSLVGFGGIADLYSGPLTARIACKLLYYPFCLLDRVLSGGWNLPGFCLAVRKNAFLEIHGFRTELPIGEDVDLSTRLRKVGKVSLDPRLITHVSGRRYGKGLLHGLKTYAPSTVMRLLFRKEKYLSFSDVRDEV